MGIFGKKKEDRPVWRNSAGMIECKGDSCPQECDNSSPIWLNTQASMMIQFGEIAQAKSIYSEIFEIAPDFYDAWNNLAAIYGQEGNYAKAKTCYAKAHEIRPERPAPVYGLALVNRDLKNYKESLRWCEEYEKLSSDGKCRSVRAEVQAALGIGNHSVRF